MDYINYYTPYTPAIIFLGIAAGATGAYLFRKIYRSRLDRQLRELGCEPSPHGSLYEKKEVLRRLKTLKSPLPDYDGDYDSSLFI